jgi:hypothetical protein
LIWNFFLQTSAKVADKNWIKYSQYFLFLFTAPEPTTEKPVTTEEPVTTASGSDNNTLKEFIPWIPFIVCFFASLLAIGMLTRYLRRVLKRSVSTSFFFNNLVSAKLQFLQNWLVQQHIHVYTSSFSSTSKTSEKVRKQKRYRKGKGFSMLCQLENWRVAQT